MRKLIGEDVFRALRIVKAAGIHDELQRIALEVSENKRSLDAKQIGADFVITCLCGLGNPKAEAEIWGFLGELTEIPADKLKKMEINELMGEIEKLSEYVTGEELMSFFESLSRLMKIKSLK